MEGKESQYELEPALGLMHDDNDTKRERPFWANRLEFLMAAVGYAVGLGNLWRFPWLLMKNGGAAFLIPYFVMLIVEGIPLCFMELAIGQRHHLGPVPLWTKVSKYAAGIGLLQFSKNLFTKGYMFTLLAWSFYYFILSFQSPLPWSECSRMKETYHLEGTNTTVCSKVGPTVNYWYHGALQISNDIEDTSGLAFNWKICLCYVTVGIIVCLCLIKGVKSTGKVVYFTVIFPYVALLIFLISGFTLEGFDEGLKHLFSMDFSRLADPYVWLQAASQIFYSLSLASGGMVTYGSYNPTHQDMLIDVAVISTINALTSFLAGLAVFSLLGHRAHILTQSCQLKRTEVLQQINMMANSSLYTLYQPTMMNSTSVQQITAQLKSNISSQFDVPHCSIQKILKETPSGSGLAFVALTEVINVLPAANFFAVMFFLMLITVGLDSSFGGIEAVITSILDIKWFRKIRSEFVVVAVCTICIASGLPLTLKSGEYFLQLMNTYAFDIPLPFVAFFELITVMYLYGHRRFCDDIKSMTGRTVGPVFKFLWCFLSPLILFVLAVTTVTNFATKKASDYQVWKKYRGTLEREPFPPWSIGLGWMLLLSQLIWIPAGAIYGFLHFRKSRKASFVDK